MARYSTPRQGERGEATRAAGGDAQVREIARLVAEAAAQGPAGPGQVRHWSVVAAPRLTPRPGSEQRTAARQASLAAYRRLTGQEPA